MIETVVNDENMGKMATLATVNGAIANGLASRMIGEGVLDEDEDDVLIPEIADLITRFGADAPAEEFLRYE